MKKIIFCVQIEDMPIQSWILLDFSKRIIASPSSRTVADKRLVVYKTPLGDTHVAHDACPHRGAALHRGTVRGDCLVCPYHSLSVCPRKNSDRYITTQEAGGSLWVDTYTLGFGGGVEPPPISPEFEDPDYRTIEYSRTVHTNPVLMAENTLDWLHLGSVHRFSLVDGDPIVTIHEKGTHGLATYEYRDGPLFDLIIENEYWIPFTTSLRFRFRNKQTGAEMPPLLLWFSLTPLDSDKCELNLKISRATMKWLPALTDTLFKVLDELPLWEDLDVVATVDPREWASNRLGASDEFVSAYREAMRKHCPALLNKYVFET